MCQPWAQLTVADAFAQRGMLELPLDSKLTLITVGRCQSKARRDGEDERAEAIYTESGLVAGGKLEGQARDGVAHPKSAL